MDAIVNAWSIKAGKWKWKLYFREIVSDLQRKSLDELSGELIARLDPRKWWVLAR
jgi:hypothetical protein